MNKNPRRNASGYIDLTAFQAICAADKENAKKDRSMRKRKKSGGTRNEQNLKN